MVYIFWLLCTFCIVGTYLPFFNSKNWFFRDFDYIRSHLMIVLLWLFLLSFLFESSNPLLFLQFCIFVSVSTQAYFIYPYMNIRLTQKKRNKNLKTLSILSINVHQDNSKYWNLIELVKEVKPDIVFTMETNKTWEKNISDLEKIYPYTKKNALENMYGMHIYSKVKLENIEVLHLRSKDRPTIHAELKWDKNRIIHLFWFHPPPPSPTESETSIPKDSELKILANKITQLDEEVLVCGDFNSVAWSKGIKSFVKISGLIDARKWRGLFPSCPAILWKLAFPIDLLFHTKKIKVLELKPLKNIGSDHLPIYFKITIED